MAKRNWKMKDGMPVLAEPERMFQLPADFPTPEQHQWAIIREAKVFSVAVRVHGNSHTWRFDNLVQAAGAAILWQSRLHAAGQTKKPLIYAVADDTSAAVTALVPEAMWHDVAYRAVKALEAGEDLSTVKRTILPDPEKIGFLGSHRKPRPGEKYGLQNGK